jgi:hypothetical protein
VTFTKGRIGLVVLAAVLVFFAVAGILVQAIPGPHGPTDYLAIGTAATFASLLIVFLILIKTWANASDAFIKRRRAERSEPPREV